MRAPGRALGPLLCAAVAACSEATAPKAVSWTGLASGASHSCGVWSGGAAYCWGWNTLGQLGDGSAAPRLRPVAVAGGLTFASLTAGEDHTCGLTSGGAAYCWGFDNVGQLGDGSTTQHTTPLKVGG